MRPPGFMPSDSDIQNVSPALAVYTNTKLLSEVWNRPDLSPRDRSLVTERGIGIDLLPAVSPTLLPLDPAAERQRAARVDADVGPVSSGLVEYTSSLLLDPARESFAQPFGV